MPIQQNTDRIQTTHIGSLPRPHDLLDLMKAKLTGKPYDQKHYDTLVAKSPLILDTRNALKGRKETHIFRL